MPALSPRKTMSPVFISYASADIAAAERMEYWLQSAGYETWRDRTRLRAGDRWRLEIEKAIERSVIVIALLSETFFESENCGNETDYARELKKRVVPVRLSANIHAFGFSGRNMIDFGQREVLSALEALQIPPAPGTPARRSSSQVVIDPFAESLLGEDLVALVESYEETERNVVQQLITFFHKHLESLGALPKGRNFDFFGRAYELTIAHGAFHRSLDFVLLPVAGPSERRSASASVASIGRINRITIEWALPN